MNKKTLTGGTEDKSRRLRRMSVTILIVVALMAAMLSSCSIGVEAPLISDGDDVRTDRDDAPDAPDQDENEDEGQDEADSDETKVAEYFDDIRENEPSMIALLQEMPKGGDLHNHTSGTIDAEMVLQTAIDRGLFFDRTAGDRKSIGVSSIVLKKMLDNVIHMK
jgi:hypothetical protein